jgi:hypothetical protein
MVIHSSPGSRRRKKVLPKEEVKKTVAPAVPEKKVVIKECVKVEEPITAPVIDDPTAEEFIATLPKKQSRKKVTKIIEE